MDAGLPTFAAGQRRPASRDRDRDRPTFRAASRDRDDGHRRSARLGTVGDDNAPRPHHSGATSGDERRSSNRPDSPDAHVPRANKVVRRAYMAVPDPQAQTKDSQGRPLARWIFLPVLQGMGSGHWWEHPFVVAM